MKNLNNSNAQSLINAFFIPRVKVLIIAIFMGFTLLSSCSEDDVVEALGLGCTTEWEDFNDSYVADFTNALVTYQENPTSENCIAYKNAGNRYVDVLEDLEDCFPGYIDGTWDEYVQEARDEISNFCD